MKSIVLDFFKKNLDLIESCDGGGLDFSLPKFELRPTDFLRFAEEDLSEDLDMKKLINITSNLKRAMDCELDTLMCVLGLDEYKIKRGRYPFSGVLYRTALRSIEFNPSVTFYFQPPN